ncbi:MAG: hypothetical protein ACRDSF_00500 [Pseudonocardiaceae bacterium]
MTARRARLVFEPLVDWPYPPATLERSPLHPDVGGSALTWDRLDAARQLMETGGLL